MRRNLIGATKRVAADAAYRRFVHTVVWGTYFLLMDTDDYLIKIKSLAMLRS